MTGEAVTFPPARMPVALFQIAEARHRPKRDVSRSRDSAEKDPGKACRCETLFLPKSILRLSPRKIAYLQSDRFVLDKAGGHQPKQSLSGFSALRGSRCTAKSRPGSVLSRAGKR